MANDCVQPYVGPRPFGRQDSDFFFGRDAEVRELVSLVIAHPVVVLCAASGAGKTSLINAGLLPGLEKHGFEALPTGRVRGVTPEDADLEQTANPYALNVLACWTEHRIQHPNLPRCSLGSFLRTPSPSDQRDDTPSPRIAVFDQLEELFTSYPTRWRDRRSFLEQVRDMLDDQSMRVVFSIREEYATELDSLMDVFADKLPVRFHLTRLREKAALRAIKEPVNRAGRHFDAGVAESLLQDLITARVDRGSGRKQTVECEFVEPVQLQVVCQSIWRSLRADQRVITQEDLEEAGDLDMALSRLYESTLVAAISDTSMSVGCLRRWFEEHLITPERTRAFIYRGAHETIGIPNSVVEACEDLHIIRAEFRAGAIWYELSHERLIEPILGSNRRWLQGLYAAAEEKRRRLEARAAAWAASNQGRVHLLDGQELAEAEQWIGSPEATELGTSPELLAWVQASRVAAEEKSLRTQQELDHAHEIAAANACLRKQRLWLATASWALGAMVLILGLAVVRLHNQQRALQTSEHQAAQHASIAQTRAIEAERERTEARRQTILASRRAREAEDARAIAAAERERARNQAWIASTRLAARMSERQAEDLWNAGKKLQAQEMYRKAQHTYAELGDASAQCSVLLALAESCLDDSKLPESIANAKAALKLSEQADDRALAVKALTILAKASEDRMDTSAAVGFYETAAMLQVQRKEPQAAARLYITIGQFFYGRLGDTKTAAIYFDRGLTLFRSSNDLEGQMLGHLMLGLAYDRQGNYEAAAQQHEVVLTLSEGRSETDYEALSALNLAQLWHDKSDHYQEALSLYRRAAALFGESGDATNSALALQLLVSAVAYCPQSSPSNSDRECIDDALEYCMEAVEALGRKGMIESQAECYSSLGDLYARSLYRNQDDSKAAYYYTMAADKYRACGAASSEAEALSNAALAHADIYHRDHIVDEMAIASKQYEESAALYNRINDYAQARECYCELARLYEHDDDLTTVIAMRRRSLEMAEASKDPLELMDALDEIVHVLLQTGELEQSMQYCERLAALAHELGDGQKASLALCEIGLFLQNQGRDTEGLGYLERAYAAAEKEQRWAYYLNVCARLAEAYEHQNRCREAATLYERVLDRQRAEDRTGTALTLTTLAQLYEEEGDLETAGQYYRESVYWYLRMSGSDLMYNNAAGAVSSLSLGADACAAVNESEAEADLRCCAAALKRLTAVFTRIPKTPDDYDGDATRVPIAVSLDSPSR